MTDYYCRIFSRHHDSPEPITQDWYKKAVAVLRDFDFCRKVESPSFARGLSSFLGWRYQEVQANKTRFSLAQDAKLLLKLKFKQVWRRWKYPLGRPRARFPELFRQENAWDYRLHDKVPSPADSP